MNALIKIEVQAMGPKLLVKVDDRPIDKWDGPLSLAMFLVTIDRCRHHRDDVFRNRGTFISRDEYFSILWPGLSVREATNVFHVTKRKITERLQMATPVMIDGALTVFTNGLYILSDQFEVTYDVGDFEAAYQSAEADFESLQGWLQARDLYKGPFLGARRFSDPFSSWVEHRQQQIADRIGLVNRRIQTLSDGETS